MSNSSGGGALISGDKYRLSHLYSRTNQTQPHEISGLAVESAPQNYFRRTHDPEEVDLVEELDGRLFAPSLRNPMRYPGLRNCSLYF